MQGIIKRIEILERESKKRNLGLFTVFYKDKTAKLVSISEILRLCLDESESIEYVREEKPRTNAGEIESLANALLVKTS